MKILLLTFTGSGNTKLCGEFLGKHFRNEGHEVTHYVYNHKNPFNEDVNKYDWIGLGYPIHAFNTPEIFYKWMKSLPKVNNKPYFIYKVSGEPFFPNNSSSHHFVKKLAKKGYVKKAEKHFLMPYNIIFRYNDEITKQMYLYLDALTELFTKEILNEDYETIPYRFGTKLISFLLRIEWIAPKVNAPFVTSNKLCNHCGLCENNCPTEAIHFNKKGKVRIYGRKCAMCMRCTYSCPQNAIRYGFMNLWKVNGPYNYSSLAKNEEVNPNYINENTKGYFHKFNKYFKKQNLLLEKYKIDNPIKNYLTK